MAVEQNPYESPKGEADTPRSAEGKLTAVGLCVAASFAFTAWWFYFRVVLLSLAIVCGGSANLNNVNPAVVSALTYIGLAVIVVVGPRWYLTLARRQRVLLFAILLAAILVVELAVALAAPHIV